MTTVSSFPFFTFLNSIFADFSFPQLRQAYLPPFPIIIPPHSQNIFPTRGKLVSLSSRYMVKLCFTCIGKPLVYQISPDSSYLMILSHFFICIFITSKSLHVHSFSKRNEMLGLVLPLSPQTSSLI